MPPRETEDTASKLVVPPRDRTTQGDTTEGGTETAPSTPAVTPITRPQAPLVIACIPWCDQVRVDGDGWGATPIRDRTVAVGDHEVHLRAVTGGEHTLSVDVGAEGTKLCWDFEREGPCEEI